MAVLLGKDSWEYGNRLKEVLESLTAIASKKTVFNRKEALFMYFFL